MESNPLDSTLAGERHPARQIGLWLGPLAAIAIALLADDWRNTKTLTLAITAWCAIWWLSEPIDAAFSAFLPLALFPLFGVLDAKAVAMAYGNELILLLAGGFMLSAALERTGAHRRMALGMVRMFGVHSGRALVWGFVFASGLISMWISNTATTLMLLPVALAILETYPDKRLAAPLILGIAYAASIGGWGTPIGTPPNLVFMQVYEQTTGTRMGFFEWMKFGVPVVAVMLPICAWWLSRNLKNTPAASVPHPGAWSAGERRVLLIFGAVALAWVFRTEPFGGWSKLLHLPGANDASVALMGVALLAVTQNGKGEALLDWPSAAKIPWGALVLFGGGIAIASAFQASGLSDDLAARLQALHGWPVWLMIPVLCLIVTLFSEIASNTATAVLLMPILAASGKAAGVDPALLMVPAVLAASCGFMLPVATAPNAVAYGTGKFSARRMMREGFVLDLLGVIAISTVCVILFW